MKLSLLNHLVCPACNSSLILSEAEESGQEIINGKLICQQCAQSYPVVNAVPRFVPQANYADSFGFQWNLFRQTQLDSYTGTDITRDRFLKATAWSQDSLPGKLVLDVGCGSGRFAEVALTLGLEVIAIDYSNAVEACWQNLHSHPRFHVVQADIYALPFRKETFDYIYCLGVLQHTPEPQSALFSLPPYLKPGGHLAVDFYQRALRHLLHPKYLLRPVTTRMPKEMLFRIVSASVPVLLPVSRTARKVPMMGRILQRVVPVANYEGVYPLNKRQVYEWAVLDTFDWLSPAYDHPQTPETLHQWLTEAGIGEIEICRVGHLVGRGRRDAQASAGAARKDC